MGEPAKMIVTLTVDELQSMIDNAVTRAIGNAPAEPSSPYVDMETIAAHFQVSKSTVSKWLANGCPHIRRSKRMVRFELSAVEAWVRGRSTPKLGLVR